MVLVFLLVYSHEMKIFKDALKNVLPKFVLNGHHFEEVTRVCQAIVDQAVEELYLDEFLDCCYRLMMAAFL